MNEIQIDIEAIAMRRKQEWIAEARKTISIQQRIADSVPWWLIIVASVLFALSAPHTAQMFNQLTPGFGFLAPLGVEFSLLYAAFRRKVARQRNENIPFVLWLLEILMFITAIIVNGAGALVAVTNSTGVQSMSFQAIADRFSSFSVIVQVGLILVPLAAVIIPLGTWAAGEGLADLFLRQRESGAEYEKLWKEVEQEELRRAVFAELIRMGIASLEARRRADSLSTGLVRGQQKQLPSGDLPVQIEALPEPHKASADAVRRPVQPFRRPQTSVDVRGQIRTYLETHPEGRIMSARNLSIAVTGSDRSRQVANEELQKYRTKE